MKSFGIILIVLASTSSAWAAQFISPRVGDAPQVDDGTPLGHSYQRCLDTRIILPPGRGGDGSLHFDDTRWGAGVCAKIEAQWQQTEAAKRAAALKQKAQDDADRAQMQNLVK